MEVVIDTYRKHEIRFNPEKETFVCDIDDDRSVKKSFSVLKKFIDDYIKENDNFKPVKIMVHPYRYSSPSLTQLGKAKIVGIRKDERLIIDKNGGLSQMPDYDMKDWILDLPDNEDLLKKRDRLIEHFKTVEERFKGEMKSLADKLLIITVADWRYKYVRWNQD